MECGRGVTERPSARAVVSTEVGDLIAVQAATARRMRARGAGRIMTGVSSYPLVGGGTPSETEAQILMKIRRL
jgi:hypothetical protein